MKFDFILLNPSLEIIRKREKGFCFPWVKTGGHGWMFQPALFLTSFLKKNNIESLVIDFELYNSDLEDVLIEKIKEVKYVGLSVMTAQVPHAIKLSEKIRNVNKNIKIIWGGIHSTLLPEQTLKSEFVDYVVIGNGEKSLFNILNEKYQKKTIVNDEMLSDEMCFPNYDCLEMDKYFSFQDGYKNVDILTSRGCPHSCTFCVNSILKNKYMFFDENKSIEIIKKCYDKFRFKHTFVMDENFFGKIERAITIIDFIKTLGITWEANISVREILRLDSNNLRRIKESGCTKLRMGAESGSDKILKILNKNITVNQTIEARDLCLKFKIKPVMSFMINLPDETDEDKNKTLQFVRQCSKSGADIIGPQTFRPYPGSIEYKKLVDKGLKIPSTLEEWANSKLFNTI